MRVNAGYAPGSSERSSWAIAELATWGRTLSLTEMEQVATYWQKAVLGN